MFDAPLSTHSYVIGEMTSTFDSTPLRPGLPGSPPGIPSETHQGQQDQTGCRSAADLFRALGDIARLRTLMILTHQEMCVTDLATSLGEGLSTVSQRLRLLRSERLVAQRRVGKHVYYALADQKIAGLIQSAIALVPAH